MPVYALTGNDTIQVAGRVLRNFGDGDVAKVAFPNDLIAVKTGKNGNSAFNSNASGRQAEVDLRLIRGSADDVFLNNLLTQQLADLPSFPLMSGYFVKRIGDGQGNISYDSYLAQGGVFVKIPEAAENTEGATDPALAIYKLKFATIKRAQL